MTNNRRALILFSLVSLFTRLSLATAQQVPIETFVQRTYFEGVPYEEAIRYPASVIPSLLGMLRDRSKERYWANIVGVIGMIGREDAADSLMAFATGGVAGTLSPDEFRARSSAVLAIGFVVNRTGGRRALDYLIESARPERWSARGLRWRSPFHARDDDRNSQLASMAILGLALTGRAEARTALESLRGPAAPASLRATAAQNVVNQALVEHQAIARDGLAQYYRARRR